MSRILGPNGLPLSVPPAPDALRKEGFGDSALPHPLTFAALFNTSWKTYYQSRYDEARRKDPYFAETMRNDSFLTGLLWERTLAVTSLPWHLEVDDENDPRQCAVRDHLTKQVKKCPRFRGLMKSLQYEGVYYGRTAVETNYSWCDMPFTLPVLPAAGVGTPPGGQPTPGQPPAERDPDGGLPIEKPGQPQASPTTPAVQPIPMRSLYVKEWFPISGDKIGHLWNGTPTILVNASQTDKIADAEFIYNDLNKALVVSGSWADHLLFHYTWREDSDFFDGYEKAEAVFGVGIRSKVALWQWIRMEWIAKISDFMDRSVPRKLWYYELGNEASKAAVELAAKTDSNKTDIILPRSNLNKNQGVEYLEASLANVTVLKELVQHIEQEYIIPLVSGQKMSRDHTGSGGLGGSGAADLAGDTKGNITEDDANGLAETLTGSQDVHGLVYFLQRHTFPDTLPGRPGGFPIRFMLGYMDPKGKERLETIQIASEMVPVKAADVYKAAGLTKPTATDELAEKPEAKPNPFEEGGKDSPKGDDFEPKPDAFSADARGNEHAPAGSDKGGQFVSKSGAAIHRGVEQAAPIHDPKDWTKGKSHVGMTSWRSNLTGRQIIQPEESAPPNQHRHREQDDWKANEAYQRPGETAKEWALRNPLGTKPAEQTTERPPNDPEFNSPERIQAEEMVRDAMGGPSRTFDGIGWTHFWNEDGSEAGLTLHERPQGDGYVIESDFGKVLIHLDDEPDHVEYKVLRTLRRPIPKRLRRVGKEIKAANESPDRHALDQQGHDHAPTGKGGGRFVPKHQQAVHAAHQNARKGVAGAKDRKAAVAAIKDAASTVKETMTAHVAEKLGPLLESLKKQHGRTVLGPVKKQARAFAAAVALEFRESMAGALANSGSKLDVLDAIEDDPIDWRARLDDLASEVETEVENEAADALSQDAASYPNIGSADPALDKADADRLDADARSIARAVAAETRAALAEEAPPAPAESPLKQAAAPPAPEPDKHALDDQAPPGKVYRYDAAGLWLETREPKEGGELVTRVTRAATGRIEKVTPTFEPYPGVDRYELDSLGHNHAGAGPGGGRFIPKGQQISAAKELAAAGKDYGEIGEELGCSKLAAQYLADREREDRPTKGLPDESRPELSLEDRAHVWDYTREAYGEINAALRSGADPRRFPLHAAVEKAKPFTVPVKVKRGIEIEDEEELESMMDSFREAARDGGMVDFPGFVSTSTASSFGGNVQFEILVRRGLDASNYSENMGELLLPAGSSFRVLSVKGGRVSLEQILEGENG